MAKQLPVKARDNRTWLGYWKTTDSTVNCAYLPTHVDKEGNKSNYRIDKATVKFDSVEAIDSAECALAAFWGAASVMRNYHSELDTVHYTEEAAGNGLLATVEAMRRGKLGYCTFAPGYAYQCGKFSALRILRQFGLLDTSKPLQITLDLDLPEQQQPPVNERLQAVMAKQSNSTKALLDGLQRGLSRSASAAYAGLSRQQSRTALAKVKRDLMR